ncbi:heme peroxidase [Mycena albidolilacea]|uniref:Peroxidase n=1 Tax=Mycena albidolilacea TaxID=1033008 RepID=A0AAD6ZPR8_9AGAR|nr:heme peroxidase [Mycena albidolilacea]
MLTGTTVADVLTLAAIAAIENCRGPSIPFCGRHIDVVAPNAPGVPQPQEDLATFKWQEFSKTEMIGLLACGHTFSSVAHPPFPNVMPNLNDTSNTHTNTTTNSDAWIFGSNRGKVMRRFASSPAFFASTCASLFVHMLDTIPSGVVLSEVLMPLPVKLDMLQLMLDGDKLLFAGEVRVQEWLSMSGQYFCSGPNLERPQTRV